MEEFTHLTSQRKKPLLIHDGFIYNLHSDNNNDIMRWRCQERTCPGSLFVREKKHCNIT
jgi:hypothetical protein